MCQNAIFTYNKVLVMWYLSLEQPTNYYSLIKVFRVFIIFYFLLVISTSFLMKLILIQFCAVQLLSMHCTTHFINKWVD